VNSSAFGYYVPNQWQGRFDRYIEIRQYVGNAALLQNLRSSKLSTKLRSSILYQHQNCTNPRLYHYKTCNRPNYNIAKVAKMQTIPAQNFDDLAQIQIFYKTCKCPNYNTEKVAKMQTIPA